MTRSELKKIIADGETVHLDCKLEKNRYRIPAKEAGLFWEVDEFFGANAPLVTAEIELPDETTVIELLDWIGREVTDDHRYKNNNLAEHPFSEWCERRETK